MKFLCDNCKAKYQIGDDKVAGKTVRMKCRRCGHLIEVSASVTESSVARATPGETVEPGELLGSVAPAPVAGGRSAPRPLSAGGAAGGPPRPGAARPAVASVARLGAPAAAVAPRSKFDDEEMTSVMASPLGESPSSPGGPRPAAGVRSAGRPSAAPRAGSLAAPKAPSLGSLGHAAALQAEPESEPANANGGVAGAFARALASERPPPSGAHLTHASEDWYVGIGGVPVGPIRLSAIREKAQAGQVNEESLVWREGFDEWQPLRTFPHLLEVLREAQFGGRGTQPPRRTAPPAARASRPPPAPAASNSAFGHDPLIHGPSPAPGATTPSPGAASPFVLGDPFAARPSSGGALPLAPQGGERSAGPSVGQHGALGLASPLSPRAEPSPLGAAPAPTPNAPSSRRDSIAPESLIPRRRKSGLHPLAYPLIAMAAVFGGVAAWAIFVRDPGPGIQVSLTAAAPPEQPLPPGPDVPAPPPVEDVAPSATPTAQPKGPVAKAPTGERPSTPTPKTNSNGQPGYVPGPGPAPGSGPDPGAGELSAGEIQSVVARNQPLIKRQCWQPALDSRGPGGPSSARVAATITIGPNGSVQSASAGGSERDFPGLSACIQQKVSRWKFPPSSGSKTVQIPFYFAGQ